MGYFERSLSIIFIIAFFFQRPTLLGQKGFAEVGILLAGVIAIVICANQAFVNYKGIRIGLCTVLVAMVVLQYFFVQIFVYLLNGTDMQMAVNVFKYTIIFTILYSVFKLTYNSKEKERIFVDIVSSVLCLLTFSSFVTLVLSLIVDYDNLVYFETIRESSKGSKIDVCFPFTTIWSQTYILGRTIPRSSMWFGEPGLYQIFAVWVICYLKMHEEGKPLLYKLKIFILSISVILSFSTAGLVGLALAWSPFLYRFRFQSLFGVIPKIALVATMCFTAYYVPYYGIKDKITNEKLQTFTVRERAMSDVVSGNITLHGKEFRNVNIYESSGNEMINFVAKVKFIGLVGLVSYLVLFITVPLLSKSEITAYAYCVFPILFTSFTTQPIDSYPIILLLLTVHYEWARVRP